jgi:hypothetical protein
MILISTLIKADAVRSRSCPEGPATRLILGVKVKTAHEIVCVVVETGEPVWWGLVERNYNIRSTPVSPSRLS